MAAPDLVDDLLRRGFTRRGVLRVLALAGAGATLPFTSERALAQLSNLGKRPSAGSVVINANEFPEGPTDAALQALAAVARNGNRYQYAETRELIETAAKLEGLSAEHFVAYAGSSMALHHCVISFTSPERAIVTAEPGYEAAANAAGFIGASIVRVPLRADGGHDVKAMVEASKSKPAGLFYVCNPNNPTGSITKRADIEWLIANKPAGSVVLLDEAYIHFSDEPPAIDLVLAGKDVVVLRTFSKIYGMAGLRAGFAIARPDLVQKMGRFQSGAMPVTAMAAAHAMLRDPALVPTRKRGNTARRSDLMTFLAAHGFAHTPSVSNKLMIDARMPTQRVIDELAARDVFVGRAWPVWPTHVRVTIGSADDMARFKVAFLEVASNGGAKG